MDAFLQDLKQAVRGLTRSPGVAAAAVACFALGIGANAVMFGIVDTLFLRAPAHVRAPAQVVRVYVQGSYPGMGTWVAAARSYPEYLSVAKEVPAFSATAAYWPTPVSIGAGAGAERAQADLVSQSYFPLLGVVPARGRFLEEADDRAGAAPVAVLSDAFWARHFGRDTAAIGRTLDVGGMPCVIVGVAPKGFTGIDLPGPDLWLPIAGTGPSVFAPDVLTSVGDMWLGIIGRLRPGVATPAAIAEVSAAFAGAGRPTFKGETPTHVLLGPVQEARGPDRSREASVALWVGAMAIIVLLIACANVTNLLLARGVSRRRDIGIRLAVGARPYRIARMLVLEAIILAALGAAAAVLLALWGAPVVQSYFLPGDVGGQSVLDFRELATMAGVAFVAAILSVAVPTWRATRPSLATSLTSGPRETGGQRWRGIRGLLAVQTALALVLLVGAGLFVQSVRHLEGLDLGLQPDRVLNIKLDARGARISQDQIPSIYQRVASAVRGLGGVQSASLAMGSPFGFGFGGSLTLRDGPTPRDFPGGGPYQFAVTPDYFETMGMSIVEGRGFTADDRTGSAKVIVLNQTLARAYWPNEDPLGRCLLIDNDRTCATVIGVVKDTPRWTVLELHGALYYVPISQVDGAMPTAILARTRGQPDALIAAVRHAIVSAVPNLPFVDITPLESSIAPQLKPWRLGKTMFTMYGALALLLTALGLYGVLAYMVGRRTQEIGVRMALGAEAGRVRRLILRDGLAVVGIGMLVGVGAVIVMGRLIAGQLFQESPRDPAVIGGAGAALLVAAIAACWLPARRATRVNPVDALRAE